MAPAVLLLLVFFSYLSGIPALGTSASGSSLSMKIVKPNSNHPSGSSSTSVERTHPRDILSRDAPPTIPIQPHFTGYYRGVLQLGTPQRNFTVIVDTFSSDLWVQGSYCFANDDPAVIILPDNIASAIFVEFVRCGGENVLGTSSSLTYQGFLGNWRTEYGNNEFADGVLARDVLTVAGLTLNHTFGSAYQESPELALSVEHDGILGLAKQEAAQQRTKTLVNALVEAGLINALVVSYKIPRFNFGETGPGQPEGDITFGGLNEAYYDPSQVVQVPNANEHGLWGVQFDEVVFNRGEIPGPIYGTFDINSKQTVVPNDDANDIHQLIPGAFYYERIKDWTVPCDTNITVTFNLENFNITLQPADIAITPVDGFNGCHTGFSAGGPSDDFVETGWLIGENILRNVYFSTDEFTDEVTLARLR